MIYTWKDVERTLLLNKNIWAGTIAKIDTYSDEVIVYVNDDANRLSAEILLSTIFGKQYDRKNQKIEMELPGEYLEVTFEIEGTTEERHVLTPLFKSVLYQKSAYADELLEKELPGVPVIAFHSYKGGVGRTLSLLAFVKAWSSLKDVKSSKRLLTVDADLEAPGITWLTSTEEEPAFSYLDLLEIAQQKNDIDEIVNLIADRVEQMTIKIETEVSLVEHYVLPTYRYIEQLLDMYSSPESLASSYKKKYILAEVLSALGKRINAEYVLVDLRAGLSEFSAPLLFDPRVKKYLVTSTSYQSVKGTEILLSQIKKGLPMNEGAKIPEILLTMVQEGIDTSNIISGLVAVYDQNISDEQFSVTDDIVTELPFASELVHLESLQKIMRNLSGRDFYNRILEIVQNSYFPALISQEVKHELPREEAIKRIHECAGKQITAEGNSAFEILLTDSIQNLIRKFSNRVPNAVIMGAKGSGKTFLYREMLRWQYWDRFIKHVDQEAGNRRLVAEENPTLVIPLCASSNADGFSNIIGDAIKNFNSYSLKGKMSNEVCVSSKDQLVRALRQEHDVLGWKEIWKKVILKAFGNAYRSLEGLDRDLKKIK